MLAEKLSFDGALARCVRQEVEDHLREAAAAEPADNPLEAARRAIENFGDPDAIAAQFAVVSLAKHTKKAGVAVILMIAGVFIAMEARLTWYALTQWALSDDMRAVSGIVASIDRYAFLLSVVVGFAGWAYISSRRTPAALYPSYRKQLRHFFVLCTIATGGLLGSVISDGVLTVLRLFETELSFAFLVPVLSIAIEVACTGVLVFHIRGVTQRVGFTEALLAR